MKISRRKFLFSSFASIITLIIYSTYERFRIEITNLNLDLGYNIRLLHITDLHLHGWGPLENITSDILKELSTTVDLIIITGDTYDELTPSLQLVYKMLSGLGGYKIGVFGNHEHWSSNKFPIDIGEDMFKQCDVHLLNNEIIVYKGIKIGGIDWYEDIGELGKSYLSAIGDVDILLSHTPDVIGLNPSTKLILAGHTHGGQINIPFLGPLFTPSIYGAKYASGLFRENNKLMYVSRGLGESYFFPFRFNCSREVVVFDL